MEKHMPNVLYHISQNKVEEWTQQSAGLRTFNAFLSYMDVELSQAKCSMGDQDCFDICAGIINRMIVQK